LFTDNSTSCYVHLKAIVPDSREQLEIHLFQETEHTLNFVNYTFRHRTLTLLGEVKKCQETYDNSSQHIYDVNYLNPEVIKMYKSKMQALFDEMRKYMEENDKQNKFIKMLCDDIHISMKTFGTKYGNMCISSRQTSQGTQRIYTVNTTPLDYVNVSVNVNNRSFAYDSDDDIQKAPASSFNNDSDSDEDVVQKSCFRPIQRACFQSASAPLSNLTIDPEYEVSNDCMEDSPYLIKTATTIMNTISYVSSSDSEKEETLNYSDSDSDSDNDELPKLVPIDNDSDSSNNE
jgi:hypothetical protein